MSYTPSNWYKYDFPLEEKDNAPKPSTANYESKNVAWLIEFFASMLGNSSISTSFSGNIYDEIILQYENNTPQDRSDDIYVGHPLDKNTYLAERISEAKEKSPELLVYETYAKRSTALLTFQDNSPANIKYFKDI